MFFIKDVLKMFLQILQEPPVLESLFNKVAGRQTWSQYSGLYNVLAQVRVATSKTKLDI